MNPIRVAVFPLGRLVATPGVLEAVPHDEITAAIARHHACDWGEVSEEDRIANDHALERGARLVSAYTSKAGVRFWIITEADRSVSTVLLPEDY